MIPAKSETVIDVDKQASDDVSSDVEYIIEPSHHFQETNGR